LARPDAGFTRAVRKGIRPQESPLFFVSRERHGGTLKDAMQAKLAFIGINAFEEREDKRTG